MTKEPVITYSELMKELDSCRQTSISKDYQLTEEQKNFILKARDHPFPVSFDKIANLWERAGWGKVGREWIRVQYYKLKEV